MADYISREECIKDLREYEKTAFSGLTVIGCMSRIKRIPAADVRPVAEISNAVDEVLDFLNDNSNCMPYHIYSALFDLVSGICPTAYVAEPLQAQPQDKKTKNVIHLWMEGYDCNGNHAGPSRCGVYEAETLRDAVSMWANEKPDRWKYIKMDREPPDFWGCNFFDKKNEVQKEVIENAHT